MPTPYTAVSGVSVQSMLYMPNIAHSTSVSGFRKTTEPNSLASYMFKIDIEIARVQTIKATVKR